MPYTVTKYPQGTFSWADVFSTDIEKTKTFLNELFGWTSKDMPTTEGQPDYTMFYKDGHVVAGGSPVYDSNPHQSFWTNYITVDNVDEMAKKAHELGAKVIEGPMDILDVGRTVVIQDPTEAYVSLYQPKRFAGAALVNDIGAMCWNELYTKDLEKSKDFYNKLLGWTYEPEPDFPDYTVIHNNGRLNGGIFVMTPDMVQAFPPNWSVYFRVKSVDETVAKAKELGAQYIMPIITVNTGKITFITDPAGAMFAIMEMWIPADEWEE